MVDDYRAQLDNARGASDWVATASICELDLLDLEHAIEYWRKAIEVDPNNTVALDGLERVYKLQSRWTELTDLIERRLVSETDRERKMNALRLLVEVYRDHLDDQAKTGDAARRLVEMTI